MAIHGFENAGFTDKTICESCAFCKYSQKLVIGQTALRGKKILLG